MEMPKRIWLQTGLGLGDEDAAWETLEGVTWCIDRINPSDVEYVRRDFAVRLRAALVYEACSTALGEPPELSLDVLLTDTAWLADSPEPVEAPAEQILRHIGELAEWARDLPNGADSPAESGEESET